MFKPSKRLSTSKPNPSPKLDHLSFPINLTKPPNFNSSTSPSSISTSTILHLHQLSALKSPKVSTIQFDSLKSNLQEILKIINTIHDFPESNQNQPRIQDLTLHRFKSNDRDHQLNWKDLITIQQTFLVCKSKSIPGLNQNNSNLISKPQTEPYQLTEPSSNHTIKRKGLGTSPNQESLYYYVKKT